MNSGEPNPLDVDDDDDAREADAAEGFAYDLDPAHHVAFTRRGPRLLVSFTALDAGAPSLALARPAAADAAEALGWSHLSLTSRGLTWFRSEPVISFFDAMTDGTLLDEHAQALFYGAGAGGHAALAYALCAPGARVLALAPQVALGDRAAPWDTRFDAHEDVDFATRYPVRPESLQAAENVTVMIDPAATEDRRHAEALRGVAGLLALPDAGSGIEAQLVARDLLGDVLGAAMEGALDQSRLDALTRARR